MWLIEIIGGNLNGVTLPFEKSLCLTGSTGAAQKDVLPVPEYLSKDKSLTFDFDGEKVSVYGFYRNERLKRLTENRVYQYQGLTFFVYQQGLRDPSLRRYRFKQFQPLLLTTLLLNTILTTGGLIWWQNHQTTLIGDYWKQIDSGYIKGNRLYVYDETLLNSLPKYLSANMTVIKNKGYLRMSQLSAEIVSSDTGSPVDYSFSSKKGRDQIQVHTSEIDNQVMSLFGQSGFRFAKEDQSWRVSDTEQATLVLKAHGLGDFAKRLKSFDDSHELIDLDSFPYAIFYSTQSVRYIYDTNNRYWEGSVVPNLGVVQAITREKVIFSDGSKTRVYYIPNQ